MQATWVKRFRRRQRDVTIFIMAATLVFGLLWASSLSSSSSCESCKAPTAPQEHRRYTITQSVVKPNGNQSSP